ncbi:MAG: oxidoreductase [Microbacteriaceae bacterium]|nr:oxidoreductase [Microbacteriaceae bacterium]
MSFTRRTFLIGAGSLSLLVLSACVDEPPTPTRSPTPTGTAIPTPSGILRSSWSTDPYALGSHSFMAVGSAPEHRDTLRQPILNRVYFAGEATSSDNPGTVLGAQASGALAANDLSTVAAAGERIAIIGAGIAGAEAARVLSQQGYDVVVVEARNRVGGRIQTVTGKSWPGPVELGAWRLRSVEDNVLLTRLGSLGTDSVSVPDAIFRSPTATVTTNPVGSTAVASAVAWAAAGASDLTLSAALDQSGAAKTANDTKVAGIDGGPLLGQYLSSLATVYGAQASDLSAWYGLDQPGNIDTVVTGDFGAIVKDSLTGSTTSLATAVAEVSYSKTGVSLRLGTGESLRADRVIVTVPLGVLKKETLKFNPLLPFAHRTAIAALGFGTVDSIWLKFDKPFWSTDAAVWNLVGTADDITTWYNLEQITGDPVLVGLVGGDAALRVAKLDEAQLVASALTSLRPFAA